MTPPVPSEPPRALYWACAAIAACAALVPVALAPVPPLFDYPGHLARIVTTWRMLHGDPADGLFAIEPAIIPNLAMDAVVLALMALGVPAETAGRIFLAATLLLLASGVMLLHRAAFARRSIVPVLAFAFLYGDTLLWGFVNYLFGLGVALCGVAAWLHLDRRSPITAATGLAAFAILAFFSHLLALLMLVGVIGGIAYARVLTGAPRAWCRAALAAAAFVPAAILISLAPLFRLAEPFAGQALTDPFSLATLAGRLRQLFSFALAYDAMLDKASVALLALGLLILVIRRRLAVWWPLILPAAGLLVLFLVVPDRWFGTAFLPDRLPVFIFCLALAAVDAPGPQRWLAAAVLGLTLARSADVTRTWITANTDYAPLLAAIDRVEPTARLYYATAYATSFANERRPPWGPLINYATIRQGAYSSGVHAQRTQNLLVRAGAAATPPQDPGTLRADRAARGFYSPYAPALLEFYDYVLVINPALYPVSPPPHLQLIASGAKYAFYYIPH